VAKSSEYWAWETRGSHSSKAKAPIARNLFDGFV